MNINILMGFWLAILSIAMPIFMQRTTYQGIDEDKFKKYKLKNLGFLFKGMQCQSASSHGVILPMLIIQIQGYIVGIASFAWIFVNETFHFLNDSAIVVIIAFFIHTCVVISITVITGFVSKKRYTKYKKISYILSEIPDLSGKMAFVFLDKIIEPHDVLKFTFCRHGKHDQGLDSLIAMNKDAMIVTRQKAEKEIIIKNLNINDDLLDVLCSLGNFPNCLKISKINLKSKQTNFCWNIEYCDEFFSFVFTDEYIDSSKIILIEQELANKGINYKRKETKGIKLKNQ